MKKLLSLVLALTLCLCLAVPAMANDVAKVGTYSTVTTDASGAVVKTDGSLWVWGNNNIGQLGLGDQEDRSAPVKAMDNVASVDIGFNHAAILKTDGTLWMCGLNAQGQLGTGNRKHLSIPVKVLDGVAAVSCGYSHTAAIKTDGSLWVWGDNDFGQLGNGQNGNGEYDGMIVFQTTPLKIMDNVVAVSCGNFYTAAIKADGSLWMWGANNVGELGNGGTGNFENGVGTAKTVCQSVPVKVMENVTSVSCGVKHTAAIQSDGTLWMWGRNGFGQLGIGNTVDTNTPVKVMEGVSAVSCGDYHTAAIKADGTLWVWGENYYNQLGNEAPKERFSATPMEILEKVAMVSCGTNYTAAVKQDGSLWTWGYDWSGRLGNGSAGNVFVPTKIMDGVALSASAVVPTSPTVAGFSDVHESDYFADAVAWAKDTGVTGGTSATTFSPNNTVTRAEAVTFLWRAAGSPQPTSSTSPFSDVTDANAYYYDAVLWATEQGITGGVGNNQFGLNSTLTYDQILTMLCRAAGETASGRDWSSAAVNWAAENGLTDGLDFGAKDSCPRADVVYCLWRQLA